MELRDIPLTEETLKLARDARKDQGIHETEVSFNGEAGLQEALIMCEKNPGHNNFLPVNALTADNLPEDLRCQNMVDFLKSKAKETVRLSSKFTSMERPEGYTFYHYRGSKMVRVGSGRVWSVHLDNIRTDIPCPFTDCEEVKGPHMVYGFLRIHTAKHVVFDEYEAQQTTVEFFYDIPRDRSKVVKARGLKIVRSEVEGDYCVMDCVTHDPDLCSTLDGVRKHWGSLWPSVKDLLYDKNVSVVISHPHGCAKQISIGGIVEREWGQADGDQGWYKYAYTAATCPGCSGAPVWVPGSNGLISGYAPHSGHEGHGVNKSAVWFFWKSTQMAQ